MSEEKHITVGDVSDALRWLNFDHKIKFCVSSTKREENGIPERTIFLELDSIQFDGEYCYMDFKRIS